jgi:hypothetical protein
MASVGVDDSSGNVSRGVRFFVYGDGKLLSESPVAKLGGKAVPITANIKGRKIIELVVRSAQPESMPAAVATWGEVRLIAGAAAGR